MTLRRRVCWAALCAAVILPAGVGARADFVTIGNPGNDPDQLYPHNNPDELRFGAVPYTYQISRTAVSIAEWDLFYGDGTSGPGGIGGGTAVGSFTSTYNYWNDGTRTVGTDAPAVSISFNHAAQYVNWLTTGNATRGAYTIDAGGAVTGIMSREDILATGNLYYLIPTEDEWYKAAYYTGSGYSLYAHGLDTVPPRSDGITPYSGWNYSRGGHVFPPPNHVWTVVSGTEEQNGTFNMMGNVWQWNEALLGSSRGLRGGSSFANDVNLCASYRNHYDPAHYGFLVGLRVASSIPEPTSATMLLMGAVGLLLWRRRRNA